MSKWVLISCVAVLVVMVLASPCMAFDRGRVIETYVPVDIDSLSSEAGPDNMEAHYVWHIWMFVDQSMGAPIWLTDDNILFLNTPLGCFRVKEDGGAIEKVLPNLEDYPDAFVEYEPPCYTSVVNIPGTDIIYILRDLDNDRMIEKYDISTGETVEIIEGDKVLAISNTDRYMVYGEGSNLLLYDFQAAESMILDTGLFSGCCFSADESTVIYSKRNDDDTEAQLFRLSVSGGVPEQLTVYEGGDYGKYRSTPRMHPGGNLIVYTDIMYDDEYKESIVVTNEDGAESEERTWRPIRLCVYNIDTGATIDLLPLDTIANATIGERCGYFTSRYGTFSPDGTQICYCGRDGSDYDKKTGLYIIDFNAEEIAQQSSPAAVEKNTPASFAVIQNFPNPFNPSTTITFSLPEAGHATLAVYSVAGQKVRELVSGHLTAGAHDIVWDGCDDDGNMLSSGVYVTRLVADGVVGHDRMTLMR